MKMALNKSKSGVLAIRVDGRTRQVKRKDFGGIPVISQYRYLGICILDNGRYKKFVDENHKQLQNLTQRLSSTFRDLPDTSIKW